MSRDLSVMEPGRMAWPGLTPFRFDRTQDRGNGKNLCRHHPSIGEVNQGHARQSAPSVLGDMVDRSQHCANYGCRWPRPMLCEIHIGAEAMGPCGRANAEGTTALVK